MGQSSMPKLIPRKVADTIRRVIRQSLRITIFESIARKQARFVDRLQTAKARVLSRSARRRGAQFSCAPSHQVASGRWSKAGGGAQCGRSYHDFAGRHMMEIYGMCLGERGRSVMFFHDVGIGLTRFGRLSATQVPCELNKISDRLHLCRVGFAFLLFLVTGPLEDGPTSKRRLGLQHDGNDPVSNTGRILIVFHQHT